MSEVVQIERSWPRVCPRHYCVSRGGHAPEYLRAALVEALEDTFRGNGSWWESLDIDFLDPAKQSWWDHTTARERAVRLIGQLWNCTDVVGHWFVRRRIFPETNRSHNLSES